MVVRVYARLRPDEERSGWYYLTAIRDAARERPYDLKGLRWFTPWFGKRKGPPNWRATIVHFND